MKRFAFIILLLVPTLAHGAVSQFNALSWCKADGTDQTTRMQAAVNAAVTARQPLYVPPGIVFTWESLTNTTNLLMEDYSTNGMKRIRGTFAMESGLADAVNTEELYIDGVRIYAGAIDVRSYGATGDGSTDDTAAIQAAIDYCESQSENLGISYGTANPYQLPTVYIPAGRYRLTSSLVIQEPMIMFGAGKNASVLLVSGDHPAITIYGRLTTEIANDDERTTIRDLGILGSNEPAKTSQHGIYIAYNASYWFNRATIDNCRVSYCGGDGIRSDTAISNKILNSHLIANCGAGIRLSGMYNTDIRVLNCSIRANQIGVDVQPDLGYYITTGEIAYNLIEDNKNGTGDLGSTTRPSCGIRLLRTQRMRIHNNYFEANWRGIYCQSNVSFNQFYANYYDSATATISTLITNTPDVRMSAIEFDGSVNIGNKLERESIYPVTKPVAISDANWGTYETVSTTTGTITNGSTMLVLPSSLATVSVGSLVSIAGVTGYKTVERIVNSSYPYWVLDSAADATVSGAAVTVHWGSTYSMLNKLTGVRALSIINCNDIGSSGATQDLTIPNAISSVSKSETSTYTYDRRTDTGPYDYIRRAGVNLYDIAETHFIESEQSYAPSFTRYVYPEALQELGNGWGRYFGIAMRNYDGVVTNAVTSFGIKQTGEFGIPYGGELFLERSDYTPLSIRPGLAAPTTGTWRVGSIVFNELPTRGNNVGWVCVESGTPGVWSQFGPVDFGGANAIYQQSRTLWLGGTNFVGPDTLWLRAANAQFGYTNYAGNPLVVAGGEGTGTGAGGGIYFYVAPAGVAGTNYNTLTPAMVLSSDLSSTFYGPLVLSSWISTPSSVYANTVTATNGYYSGSLPGLTTIYTNMISGVITQRLSFVGGILLTNETFP